MRWGWRRSSSLARTFASPEFVNIRFPVTLATEQVVAGLNEAQPDFLFAYPSALRSALGRHPGVAEYRVRQTADGARVAVGCDAPVDLERLRTEIAQGLIALGLAHPVVEVSAVERVERDPGPAKLRRFVPLDGPAQHRRGTAPGHAGRDLAEPALAAAG